MSESIVAKFRCESVTRSYTGSRDEQGAIEIERVSLRAAIAGESNKSWSKWTPSGELSLSIENRSAQDKIKPGKHYKITIEEVGEDF